MKQTATASNPNVVVSASLNKIQSEAHKIIKDDWGGSWKLSTQMLGSGAKGKVYLAMNLQSGELVAVKSLPIEAPKNAEETEKVSWTENLGREVGFLSKLKHQNMVGYKSFS